MTKYLALVDPDLSMLSARELTHIDKVLENIKKDKKAENGTINFVLLKKIGKAVIDNTVTPEDIKEALNELNFDEAW